MSQRRLPGWFVPVLGGLVIEVFCLIALGGAVRTMNAGLACPDWPLCFGDFIPDYHPQVYLEFIHRAMAGLVAITTMVLALALWRSQTPRSLKLIMAAAVLLLAAQIVFGGLTVLWQLHSGVVATHLAMGTAFFSMLYWIYLSVKRGSEPMVISAGMTAWSVIVVGAVFGQLVLGGLVASNYAALVCPDWPKCLGEWFPTFAGPVGLQVMHRLNAYLLVVLLTVNWFINRDTSPRARSVASGLLAMVIVQIGLGVANVFLHVPPLISVLHLATATAILSLAVRQLWMNWAARKLI